MADTCYSKAMKLVVPALDYLDAYDDALRRGWSPDNVRLEAAAREELAKIAEDPAAFVASLDDPRGQGRPGQPWRDGSKVPRLPGLPALDVGRRILRLDRLPLAEGHVRPAALCARPHRLRRRAVEAPAGLRDPALALLLDDARREGLDHVDLTTDPDNVPSQRVILANGGTLHRAFQQPGRLWRTRTTCVPHQALGIIGLRLGAPPVRITVSAIADRIASPRAFSARAEFLAADLAFEHEADEAMHCRPGEIRHAVFDLGRGIGDGGRRRPRNGASRHDLRRLRSVPRLNIRRNSIGLAGGEGHVADALPDQAARPHRSARRASAVIVAASSEKPRVAISASRSSSEAK